MLGFLPMNPAPNLVLVGPMGAGKTSIGKRLAARLGLDFVDCDQRLEQATGASVPVIFECEGEAGFRARETTLLAELLDGHGQLLATGGGAVLADANRRCMRERGFVVYLPATVDEQLERLARDRSRPLLAVADRRGKLEGLALARGPLYREVADLEFAAGNLGIAVASGRLALLVARHWQRTEAA
jgi:shikimate kinase